MYEILGALMRGIRASMSLDHGVLRRQRIMIPFYGTLEDQAANPRSPSSSCTVNLFAC